MATPKPRGRSITSRLLSGLAGLGMVLAGLVVPSAAVAAPNDTITFPDEGLHKEVLLALNDENVDNKSNRNTEADPLPPVTEDEAAELQELVYEGSSADHLTELDWVEHFTGLKYLDLRFHAFSDLSHLTGLKHLQELFLAAPGNFTYDSDTDFSALSKLDRLWYLHLQFHDISDPANLVNALQGLDNLEGLQLQSNEINDVSSFAQLTHLKFLGLQSNEVEDVTPLAEMDSLVQINLIDNRISDVSAFDGFDIGDSGHVYLKDQRIEASEADVDEPTGNPIVDLDGDPVEVTSSSGGFQAQGAPSHDWLFTSAGEKTLTWSVHNPLDPKSSDADQVFSGTITQTILPQLVLPEAPTVATCVDGEPVVVTNPDGPQGVEYQSQVTDNDDGTFTVETRAMANRDAGVEFDSEDPPAGWEHIGDGILKWTTTVTPDCSEPPMTVTPEVPVVETCVDGEPVVVTNPDGPEGVEYQTRVTDDDGGTFTVVTLARVAPEVDVAFDLDALPEGWEHIGDGILEWTTTVTPDCEDEETTPPTKEDDPDPDPVTPPGGPTMPPTGIDAGGLGLGALIAVMLGGALLLLVRGRRGLHQ